MRSCTFGASRLGVAMVGLWALGCVPSGAEEKETPAFAAAIREIPATVQQGLTSAARGGRPISAKFEMDGDEAELTVYVARPDGFREITINPRSGGAAGATLITEGDDLKDAQAQAAAMASAKTTLLASAEHAVVANPGARVVSVFPELQNGHAVAVVTLLNGDNFTRVTEMLE
jgi:hypothetical protein